MKRFKNVLNKVKQEKAQAPAPTSNAVTPTFVLENIYYITSSSNTLVRYEGPTFDLRTKCEDPMRRQVALVEGRFVPLLNISAGTAAQGNGPFEDMQSPPFWAAMMSAKEAWGKNFAMIMRHKVVAREPLPPPEDDAPEQELEPESGRGVRWPFLGYDP